MNNLNNLSNLSNPPTQTTQTTLSNLSNQTTPITLSNQTTQTTQTNQKRLFLPQYGHYRKLRVYRVAEALFDLTNIFCKRFLPEYGDRTVDQMVQAARSGKQNIAEGNQAAATSSETEIKLTNVAKASLEELLVDYEDFLRTHSLVQWGFDHPRMAPLRQWTCSETFFDEFTDKAHLLSAEEMANLCLTLCHQAIYMLRRLLETQQNRFVTEGGIKERMHRARTGYRQEQDDELARLRAENAALRARIAELEGLLNNPITQTTPTPLSNPTTQTTQSNLNILNNQPPPTTQITQTTQN